MITRTTEERFLNDRIGSPVAIFLITGLRLVGSLIDFDDDAVFLRPHGAPASEIQMIFKVAISTIVSARSIDTRNTADGLEDVLFNRARRGRY